MGVSFNAETDRIWLTKVFGAWKVTQLNLLCQERVNPCIDTFSRLSMSGLAAYQGLALCRAAKGRCNPMPTPVMTAAARGIPTSAYTMQNTLPPVVVGVMWP